MTEPSNDARQAKFEQDQLRDKQINAFLLHRKNLQDALAGNEADLKHIGYNPPMEVKEPRLTYAEWCNEAIGKDEIIVNKSGHDILVGNREALKEEVIRLNNVIDKLKDKKKDKKKKKPSKKK